MAVGTLDIILCIPLLWGAIMGFKKGLILELASLVALILGIYGAIQLSNYTAAFLTQHFEISENVLNHLSFFLTFVGIVIAVFSLAKLLTKLIKMVALGFINRLFGLLFGLLKSALILSVLLYVFNLANQTFEIVSSETLEESYIYNILEWASRPLLALLDQYKEQIPSVSLNP